jgi:diguanylate cyclase (GGDEF)-like protein
MTEWDDETHADEDGSGRPIQISDAREPTFVALTGPAVGELFRLHDGASVIGRGKDAEVRVRDEGISRAHARVLVVGDAVTLEDLDSRNGTFVNGFGISGPTTLHEGDKVQLAHGSILRFGYQDLLDDTFQRHMHRSAMRDGLTGLYNRRYFSERLHTELRFATRHRTVLGILLLDLDHFKNVNDTFGHVAGDRVLTHVAAALVATMRAEDVVTRYGGEELAVLVRGIPLPRIRITAERLRRVIELLVIPNAEGPAIQVTASIGVSCFPDAGATTADDLLAAADSSLYRAKESGRNRVGV